MPKTTGLDPTAISAGAAPLPRHIAVDLSLSRTLTPRERAVFNLLGSGYSNRSIAHELEISEGTVKRHVTAILAKLRLESRLQAGLTALLLTVFPGVAMSLT
jgi:DNA-binding NarL/FixJ family response regulator